ncbi:outer membrane beta-barrel protein [Winogradskyella wichelsiae]|uniref:outer membrane beta-barrel protein n=1 Tax=Winogradskyella wichelsiae TaxID=2697007 RepID=UPI0015CBF405|nr:outer membrane beta-barrel protein [Winogradskyella wichelsiae]
MKKLLSLTLLLTSIVLSAQDTEEATPEKTFTLSGSVDAYYQTNLTSTDQAIFGDDNDAFQSFGTSFANETGFALGMANIIASYESGKVGAVADLAFGPKGDDATGGYNINQLYAYWNVSEGTTLTMGRFNTYLGYEVISPTGNFNYSTSYLFSSGPFSHVGIKADFTLSDDFSLMLAVMNPTDVNNNLTGDYGFGAQLGYAGQYLNFYYDSGVVLGYEIDYTGGFDVSDSFFLGINAAYNDNDGSGFYGAALYPQYGINEALSIGVRGEYYGLHYETGDDDTVLGATLSANYKVDNLTIIPEVRLDSWNEDTYFNNDLEPTKSLGVFTLAAIYAF